MARKITKETAILAKIKGFDIPCNFVWSDNSGMNVPIIGTEINWNAMNSYYSAPTQSELQTWLMEVYKIDILPTMSQYSRTYGYKVYHIENGETMCINHTFEKNDKHEDAFEKGLIEGLKLLPDAGV
jgi:hypothetical protein